MIANTLTIQNIKVGLPSSLMESFFFTVVSSLIIGYFPLLLEPVLSEPVFQAHIPLKLGTGCVKFMILKIKHQALWILQSFFHPNKECHRAFAINNPVVIR